MDANILFGVSLTASFLAGVLALFAPCCITFLFPAYLGTIFKEGRKVMFYTFIFALGLSFILIPVALGARFFIGFFDEFHKSIYYLGGFVLILMGILTIKPLFSIPISFNSSNKLNKNVNIGSVFSLGLLSGLTSACCAPVLFAAITLTTLSPTLIQALLVSLAYVLGIVFPLFIISFFYKKVSTSIVVKNRQKIYEVFKYIGAGIFIISGILISIFNYQDKIQMYQLEGYSSNIRLLIFELSKNFKNPIVDITVFALIIFLFIKFLKKADEKEKK
ncbi:MAG: cytochrome c biogenesis protein CcdA [bacterium]|nr:cytochrome c biogenesis protein CcdA [bacterium]